MRKIYLTLLLAVFFLPGIQTRSLAQASITLGPDIALPCDSTCVVPTATVTGVTGSTNSYTIDSVGITYPSPYPFVIAGSTALPTDDDVYSSRITLPFTFCFYGTSYTQLLVGTNSDIVFDLGLAGGYDPWPIDDPIPSSTYSSPAIMGCYGDWETSGTYPIKYIVEGTAPNRVFIENITTYEFSCTGDRVRAQVVLHETTNIIDVYIQQRDICSGWNDGDYITGIQKSSTVAMAVPGHNQTTWGGDSLDKAYRFIPSGAPTVTLLSSTGAVLQTITNPDSVGVGIYTVAFAPVCPSVTVTSYIAQVEACSAALIEDTVTVTTGIAIVPTGGTNSPICSGETLSLTATGDPAAGVTYNWTGPDGFTSTLQNPVILAATTANAGVYSVTASYSGCTSLIGTVTAVINPLPPVPVLGSNAPLCSGSTLNLTATDTTGATYSWTGPGGFTSILQNPVISPANTTQSGVYSVIATLNGCVSPAGVEAIAVDSTPAAPVASSNTPICSDSTLYLSATDATAGVTYSWSGPDGFTSLLQNPSIPNAPVAASGTYTVTTLLGICSDSSVTVVTVNPTPPIPMANSNGPVCSGKALLLTATDSTGAIAGTTYSWAGPNGFASTLQNPNITPATTLAQGIYSIVATLNGCPSSPAILAVAVDSTPATPTISTNGPVCQGDSLSITVTTTTAGVTYFWTGPGGYSSTLENLVFDPATHADSGYYTVVITTNICSDTASINAAVDSIPVLIFESTDATAAHPICSGTGNELTLFSTFTPSSLFATYSWTGPLGFTSNQQNPSSFNLPTTASGIYSVTETLNGCTSAIYTIAVTVDSTPAIPDIFSNSPVCERDTLQLYASDATPGVSYSWSGPNSFTSLLQNPTITDVSLAAAGEYTVTVTLGFCSDSADTAVSITARPFFTPTSNSPVCSGDTLKLYANGAAMSAYTWSGPYGYYAYDTSISSYRYIVDVTTENAGVYTVTAFLNGCYTPETDTVVINNTPAVPSISWLTYCQYYPAPPLMANDTSVKWYPTDSTLPSLGTYIPPTPSTLSVGSTFYYARQIVSGCISAEDSIKVTVNPTPTVTVSPVDTAVCPHSIVVLRARDTDAIAYYRWYPSIYLNDTTGDSVIVNPETNQAYKVVASNQYGCSDTASALIKVYPAALITMADSVTLYPGESYTMNPSTNCTVLTWFPPAGLSSTTIPNPVASPVLSTDYILYGETENGCTTSDSINVYVSVHSDIHLPNAFTPGSGPNSTYKVITDGIVSLHYFRIFNRWGQKVYETTDINQGWDGTFNGTAQPLGVYIYEIEGISSTGQTIDLQGNMTLLR